MNQTQLAQVALKIVGIFAIIQSIPLLGAFIQTSAIIAQDFAWKPLAMIGTLFPFLLMISSGCCLIIFGNKIASKMFPPINQHYENIGISTKHLQAIAFSIVGILLMAFAIPHMASIIWNYHVIKNADSEMQLQKFWDDTWNYALRTGVQFLIGLFIFFGSKAVTALWNTMVNRIRFEKEN
jgi:hypothetical protein